MKCKFVALHKSVFSLQTSAVNVTLPAFDAERRCLLHARRPQLSIDPLPAGRSAANLPAAVAAVDRWDRRTDGRSAVTQTLLCWQRQQQ